MDLVEISVNLDKLGKHYSFVKLGEAAKALLVCKAWRGLGKDYSFVRSLEKLRQRILVVYKNLNKSWGLEVCKWFG